MKAKDEFALNALHNGGSLVAEVTAGEADCLGWVGVYPLNIERKTTVEFLRSQGQRLPKKNEYIFYVRKFEIEKSLMSEDVWISENELKNKSSFFAFGDEDLICKLRGLGVKLSDLVNPANSSYPI